MNIEMYDKALRFAYFAHEGQRRTDGRPYITHPIAVASMLMGCDPYPSDEEIQAALLHDTLEDTQSTLIKLQNEFGPVVASIVLELTNVFNSKDYPHLKRDERKKREHERIASISQEAIRIKLCDRLHNICSMPQDSSFIVKYLRETADLVRKIPKNPFYNHLLKAITYTRENIFIDLVINNNAKTPI